MPEILMPRLSDTMEEGTLSRWLKHEGDQVHRGDVIAEIETDKAVMELEAYDEGPLTRILVPEGTTVAIGAPVAVVGGDTEAAAPAAAGGTRAGQAAGTQAADGGTTPDAGAEATAGGHAPPGTGQPAAPPEHEPAATEAEPPAEPAAPAASGRVPTSPLARRTATQHGIDIATLTGSGPGGRVVRADVEKAVARDAEESATSRAATAQTATAPGAPAFTPPHAEQQPPPSDDVEEVPLSAVRRITAQRLTQSTQQAPHFYLTSVVDAEPLLAFRAEINDRLGAEGLRVSVNDLIVKACAVMLRTHPEVNASWADTRILRRRRVHVGIAVALDDGLTVPVVHDADRKTLTDVARETRELAEKARAGRLSLDELADGTFTVSNLGPYGVDHFTAVINPPQAAILAVGAAHPEPVVRHGELRVGTAMALTLSIDHRVLDGATGATFLADLKALLEQPLRILM